MKVNKENDMLKLVRPGGIVELYTHPMKAAQVMERHPRHFVTRPDVFKFPYFVVKPESILKPGRVFFIVPYHTIHRLLQSKGYRGQSKYISDQYEAVEKQELEYAQPRIDDDRRLMSQSLNTTPHQIKDIDTSFFHQIIPVGNIQNKKQSEHELKATPRNQAVASLYMAENRANSIYKDGGHNSDGALATSPPHCFPSGKKGGRPVETTKDRASTKASATGLKPCLRKHHTNKTQFPKGPRVRFILPDEDGKDDESWDTHFSYF